MPKATLIHASVGTPRQINRKLPDGITPSFSRTDTLIPNTGDDTTGDLLSGVSQKLGFSQHSGPSLQGVDAEDTNARTCRREALHKCSDIFVAYGPNDRSVFISPYTGFEMSRVKKRTLFDTFYKQAQLKIRRYYMTAEGDELGIHEDSSGRAGWVWMNSPKSSAANYDSLKRWLSKRQSQSPDTFATTTVAFGGPGTYFARCGIFTEWRKLPNALSQAIAARTRKIDPEGKDQVSSYARSWKISPRIVALGADETYFVLWSDDSYQYGLEVSCGLIHKLKSLSEHTKSLKSLTLAPSDPNQYFLIADYGMRALSVANPIFMRHSPQVKTHYRLCLAEFVTEFAGIVHQGQANEPKALTATDGKYNATPISKSQIGFSLSENPCKSTRAFSLFRRGKGVDMETIKQAQ